MSERPKAANHLVSLLRNSGYQQTSDGSRVPEAIDKGSSIHTAIVAFERTYAEGRIPTRFNQLTRKLLRYSRNGDAAAFDYAELLIDLLERAYGDMTNSAELDGPSPPNLISWNGQERDLPPIVWRLLQKIWRKKSIKIDRVCQYVWGDEDNRTDGALRTSLSRLNKELVKLGVPFCFEIKNGYIVRS